MREPAYSWLDVGLFVALAAIALVVAGALWLIWCASDFRTWRSRRRIRSATRRLKRYRDKAPQ